MNRSAFTLIELMIVIVVIAILAAMVIPEYSASRDDAAVQAIMADLRTIERAILVYHAHTGEWPEEQGPGKFPPELKGYLSRDEFQKTTAVGGHFDWNYKVGGATAAVAINQSQLDVEVYGKIDTQFDDGNPKTGRITLVGADLHMLIQ